ncbi:MAG TPA: hypothetical protein VHB25_12845 [Gemmatimonadaceae bacterium]|nr:hypothetical protein [Gemmatimonadaceae bacterium]
MRPNTTRRGFAMLWAIVTVAVIAAIVAAAAPTLTQMVDTTRVTTTAEYLREIAIGVDSFNKNVKRGAPSYTTPRYLHQLDTVVVAGDSIGCRSNQTNNNTAVNNWIKFGPFLTFYFSPNGLSTPLGQVHDSTSRTMGALGQRRTSQNDSVFIQIDSVDVGLARMMDVNVDGTENANADTVRYTAPGADSLVLLSWWVPLFHAGC